MGYVGGVACALLTARICQLYPNAAASTIVMRFFKIYHQWKWPQPVILKAIEDHGLQLKVWNPRIHRGDSYHKMPVITPAYPSMCSTHNVIQSTLDLMRDEFKRAGEVMLRVEQRRAGWADLFEKSDFFHRYKHFFQVIAVADSEETHRTWSGFVESRLRQLSYKLEGEQHIAGAPPFPETFAVRVREPGEEPILRAHFHADGDEEASGDEPDGPVASYTTCLYIALSVAPPDPNHTGTRRLILDRSVQEFNQVVNLWDAKTDDMRILVRDIRRDNLPSYLFSETARPPKLKRAKKSMSPPPSDEDSSIPAAMRSRTSMEDTSLEPAAGAALTMNLARRSSQLASSTEIQAKALP